MSIPFPSIRRPSQVQWALRAATQTHQSPLDGTMQTLRQPGERWVASVSWPTLIDPDRRVLEAFLAQMGGRAGRFFFGPTHAPRRATGAPSGAAALINGAGQSGSTLSTRGWLAGADAMRAGDFFSYTDTLGRRRLHMVTADAAANGTGFAALSIAPPLRRAGGDGAPIEIINPTGVFMLAGDEVGVATRPPLFGSVSLEMIEALV